MKTISFYQFTQGFLFITVLISILGALIYYGGKMDDALRSNLNTNLTDLILNIIFVCVGMVALAWVGVCILEALGWLL